VTRKRTRNASARKNPAAQPARPSPPQENEKSPHQGRHESHCSICCHAKREEIEDAFVSWISPVRISKEYGVCRDAVYRHARALDLMEKRRRNVRAALERLIEQAGEVEVNAAAVVSAVSTYARINSRGELIERTQSVDLNALFERMTVPELDAYAKDGTFPDRFKEAVAGVATATEDQGASNGR
jgi:hypothetical protein